MALSGDVISDGITRFTYSNGLSVFHFFYLMDSSSQSDSNSTEARKSTDDRLGTKLTDGPPSRVSGSPDGESPKGFGHER